MTQALVTITAPLALDKVRDAQSAIEKLGNPATAAVAAALAPNGETGTHFASFHALLSPGGAKAYLLFECSADGTDDEATARIVAAIGPMLAPIFMLASDWSPGRDLGAYLTAHRVPTGNGLFGNPGVGFPGTPGFTVGEILFEQKLAAACAARVEQQPADWSAQARVADVRATIAADPTLADALKTAMPAPPFVKSTLVGVIADGLLGFAELYLWPLALIVAVVAVGAASYAAHSAHGFWHTVWAFDWALVSWLWAGAWVAFFAFIFVALITYAALRSAEARDALEVHSPKLLVNKAMFDRENRCAQNHMISITQRKPGAVRWFTSRLVFWVIGLAATKYFEPGFLSNIGTIHFARWVTVPGTRDVVFVSNYGGSWESYLEDFITKAHAGLTGVWSNTIGFPRTENLFQKGATDGDRFKRFARHSMVPTLFWYSAYPNLATTAIRSNRAIRAGLSGSMTEDEAIAWLALFGSAARPEQKLVSSDIQSLIFGGLGFLPFGTCLICDDLPSDLETARGLLRALRPLIAFNDGRRLKDDGVVTLACAARGLARFGLPRYGLDTFPFAFLEGMTTDYRARILGDLGDNASSHWHWGTTQPDLAILVYGRSEGALADVEAKVADAIRAAGMPAARHIPMEPITKDKTEPFGFLDGISQPIIRGTYKSLRNADPIHLVEPGEMILGYPDNRGYIPPSPTLLATADPNNMLPLLGAPKDFARTVVDTVRDVGFNGSFLVIRQLEQDVGSFWDYCRQEADRLGHRLSAPYKVDAELIGAKMIGRWTDGSSIVRQPYESETKHREKLVERAQRQDAKYVVETVDPPLTRAKSNPQDAPAIESHSAAATQSQSVSVEAHGAEHRKPIRPDNDFLFGVEDPEALRCPFGAHIRRGNPRDSLDPGSADEIAISNRHRITRIGRHYKPAEGQNPGLFFMCLCADIERQFEFLQQTWLRSASFHGLSCEKDPVLSDAEPGNCGFTIPSPDGPIGLNPLPRFVTTRGGGYFFLPGRRLIDYLIGHP